MAAAAKSVTNVIGIADLKLKGMKMNVTYR
jgi:hypothetical protein